MPRYLVALVVLLCLTAVAIAVLDGGDDGDDGHPGLAPVAATFDAEQGRAFDEPAELRSRGGRLSTTFTVEERRFDVAASASGASPTTAPSSARP